METLVIISETGNVLMMSRTWDVLQEVPLFQQDFGEGEIYFYFILLLNKYIIYIYIYLKFLTFIIIFTAKFVSVGWGSKETQFHGSLGKDARSKKKIESTLADWDDKETRVVWRADGLFFAINAVEPSLGSFKNQLSICTFPCKNI